MSGECVKPGFVSEADAELVAGARHILAAAVLLKRTGRTIHPHADRLAADVLALVIKSMRESEALELAQMPPAVQVVARDWLDRVAPRPTVLMLAPSLVRVDRPLPGDLAQRELEGAWESVRRVLVAERSRGEYEAVLWRVIDFAGAMADLVPADVVAHGRDEPTGLGYRITRGEP